MGMSQAVYQISGRRAPGQVSYPNPGVSSRLANARAPPPQPSCFLAETVIHRHPFPNCGEVSLQTGDRYECAEEKGLDTGRCKSSHAPVQCRYPGKD